ncbi:MAG: DNA adenine methylase [Kiritimatiellia bacterium]
MKSPLNYLGGKSKLAQKIIARIPTDHICYCEPFCGAGWVFFGKTPSRVEVINDLDRELVTFWRVVQNHLEEFLRFYKYAVVSRVIFDLQKRTDPAGLTDIQRACRYYYLQRLSFAGKTVGRTFGTGTERPANINLSNIEETLLDVHWRLERVTIECLDANECIRRYDRPTTFFFVDPPYMGTAGYAVPFEKKDYLALRDTLGKLQGRFLLTLNDLPEVRSLFKGFAIERVSLRYSAGNNRTAPETRSVERHEVFIHNLT